MRRFAQLLALTIVMGCSFASHAQMPDNSALKAEQSEKMKSLAWLDGEWRGEAVIKMPGGDLKLTQTERIGPLLDGGTKVIEGRGYFADGKLAFNALGIINYNAVKKQFEIHSFSDGRSGIFPMQVTAEGYNWQTPAGPNATINYVVTYKNGLWTETGSYVSKDQPPRPFMEMKLRRIGDTDWPSGTPLRPK